MAALKTDSFRYDHKDDSNANASGSASPLAQLMREFDQMVMRYETGLLRSLEDCTRAGNTKGSFEGEEEVRHEACRLAIAELSNLYTRKEIRRSLYAVESHARREEEQLHAAPDAHVGDNTTSTTHGNIDDDDDNDDDDDDDDELRSIHNGYFRLYSTELFDLLGQPTDLRFGTLRFHQHVALHPEQEGVSVELALGNLFFVADSLETLPYHAFKMPHAPSLQNRGILSRKPEDNGAFPEYDSWLLFTFLGNGCLKLEVPIEMCADVYGGPLRGRENEEVHFWGVFIEDDAP